MARDINKKIIQGLILLTIVYFLVIIGCYVTQKLSWQRMSVMAGIACLIMWIIIRFDAQDSLLSRYTKKNALIVFFMVLLTRLLLFYFIRIEPVSDYEFYMQEASKYAATGRFDATQYIVIVAPNTVMYIIVLGTLFRLFGSSMLVAQVFNALLLAGSCTLMYLIAERFMKKHMALAATFSFSFLPSTFLYSLLIGTEYIALFPMFFGLYSVIRADEKCEMTCKRSNCIIWGVVCGFSLAISNVNRSNALVLWIAILIWLIVRIIIKPNNKTWRIGILISVIVSFWAISAGYGVVRDELFEGRGGDISFGWTLYEGLDYEGAGAWTEEKSRVLYDVIENYPEDEVQSTLFQLAVKRVSEYSIAKWMGMFLRKGIQVWAYDDYAYVFVKNTAGDSIIRLSDYENSIVSIMNTTWLVHLICYMLSTARYVLKKRKSQNDEKLYLIIVPVLLLVIWHSFATSICRYHYMIVPFTMLMTFACIGAYSNSTKE